MSMACPPEYEAADEFIEWCEEHDRDPDCDDTLAEWHADIEVDRACAQIDDLEWEARQ